MNPEFSGRPFAVGSLFGVRSFRVKPDGVLTGVVQQEPWAPGVNEAICRRGMGTNFAAMMAQCTASLADATWNLTDMMCRVTGKVHLTKRPKREPAPLELEPAPHQAGTLDCTCGFYAYFDEGHNPHHSDGNVLGIVEGFGVCTTGTRGFRSSKARLRALIFDTEFTEDPCRLLPLESDITERYPDVVIFRSLNAALAEFPLTPVEGARAPARIVPPWGGRTYSFVARRTGKSAFDELVRAYLAAAAKPKPSAEESVRDRALRLRRERNTGPVRDVRLGRGLR